MISEVLIVEVEVSERYCILLMYILTSCYIVVLCKQKNPPKKVKKLSSCAVLCFAVHVYLCTFVYGVVVIYAVVNVTR